MSSITGIVNVDNTLTGVEDLYLDELDVTNVVADAVASTTISLGGTDLQTTLTDLQSQITSGGGYFVLACEFAGNPVNQGRFGFGAGLNSGLLKTTMPNCSLIACRFELSSSLTTSGTTNIVVEKNGVATSGGSGAFTTGITLIYRSVANGDFTEISYSEGDVLTCRFNNAGGNTFTGSAVGTRVSFVFRTNAVNGANGTNGTNGTNGQNVSFDVPTIGTITPATTASITDTITTASGTQTHALNFNIPRGKNSSFAVGTISSVGTASPSLALVATTDGNGDNVYTMNFGLQQGGQGPAGPRGDKGDTGDEAASTLLAIASAGAAAISAGLASDYATAAAISAGLAASNGAIAGAEAGAEAAEGVVSGLETRVSTLEGEMDTQQTKTAYISQSATETTIDGARTIVNSTNGLLTNTLQATSLSVSNTINTNNLNITGATNFAGDILMADTKKLLTNNIVQRQYPLSGDILLDATNLNIGSLVGCNKINLQSDNIDIITNEALGKVTFKNAVALTDVNVEIQGEATITKSLDVKVNLLVENNATIQQTILAGTDGDFNEHTFYGGIFTQKIEGIDIDNPLNIGEDTNELQILSNNIAIGNLDVGSTTTTINNKTISIGVAEYHQGDTVEEFISKADKALYEAKETGRNKVVASK